MTDRATHKTSLILELVPPERLNILVDGVYAIVMTLLVLELKLPDASSSHGAVLNLGALAPKAVAFLIGFGVAASGWAYVHQVNLLFTGCNLVHIGLNLLA
ncbi:MAG: DUF1211 domain-containing protein, partial [Candidatus Eremiobacteraeota bacterium]|nr:DUF1211 domain-containing protein [Candidatus Eremiobacteraeota bacterium]